MNCLIWLSHRKVREQMRIIIDIPDEQIKKSLEESKYINEDEGGRIDIFIETDLLNIIIENKIEANIDRIKIVNTLSRY